MDTQKLKSLQVNQTRLENEIKELKASITELNKKINEKNTQLSAVTKEIQDIHSQHPVITEHALLRYVERILQIDLEKVKQEILSDENVKIIDNLKSCKIPLRSKFKIVVKNKSIVTIVDSSKDTTWTRKKSNQSLLTD